MVVVACFGGTVVVCFGEGVVVSFRGGVVVGLVGGGVCFWVGGTVCLVAGFNVVVSCFAGAGAGFACSAGFLDWTCTKCAQPTSDSLMRPMW